MIHLDIHGFSWGLAYWLAVVAVGVRLDAVNLRHAWRQIRAVRPGIADRRSLGASTRGLLVLDLAITVGLAISGVPAVFVQVAALASAQSLDFANATSAVAFIAVALGLASGPTVAAAAVWLWDWNTKRAMRSTLESAGPGPTPPAPELEQ